MLILLRMPLVVLSLLLLSSSGSFGQIITNGAFEQAGVGSTASFSNFNRLQSGSTSLRGWTIGGVAVDWHSTTNPDFQPSSSFGDKVIDLHIDGGDGQTGTLSQTFSTSPGREYELSFDLSGPGVSLGFPNPRSVNISIGNVQQTFSTPASANTNMQWSRQEVSFTASGDTTTLTFSSAHNGAGFWGPVLDNVSVVAAPDPVAIFDDSDAPSVEQIYFVEELFDSRWAEVIFNSTYNGVTSAEGATLSISQFDNPDEDTLPLLGVQGSFAWRGILEAVVVTPNLYESSELSIGVKPIRNIRALGINQYPVSSSDIGITTSDYYQGNPRDLDGNEIYYDYVFDQLEKRRLVLRWDQVVRDEEGGTTTVGFSFAAPWEIDPPLAVEFDNSFRASTDLKDLLQDGLNGRRENEFVKITNLGLFAGDTNPFNPATRVEGTGIQTCFTDPELGFGANGVGGPRSSFLQLLLGSKTANGELVHFGWVNELKLPSSIRGFVVDDILFEDALEGNVKYDPIMNKVGLNDTKGNFVPYPKQRPATGYEIDPPVRSAGASSTSFVIVGSDGTPVVLHQDVAGFGEQGFDSFPQYFNVNLRLIFPGEFEDIPALPKGTYGTTKEGVKEATSFRTELVGFDPNNPSEITRLGLGFKWKSNVEGTLREKRTVLKGETLSEIAAEYDVTIDDILLNNLENDGIIDRDTVLTGTELNLPNQFNSGGIGFLANRIPLFVTSGSVFDLAFIAPVPETILGDVNLDGNVNFLDISPFISVLSTGDNQAEADCNEDGEVNFLDISPFIGILAGNN